MGGGGKRMFGIFWIVILVLLAAWGWSFLKKEKGFGLGNTQESALDILKRRYAEEEISKEEFDEKKRDLDL